MAKIYFFFFFDSPVPGHFGLVLKNAEKTAR